MPNTLPEGVTTSANEYAALRALGKFHLIEFSLKLYLAGLQRLTATASLTSDVELASWSFAELDDLPFGILLKRFAKFCEDASLLDRLRAIKSARDIVAHRAVAYARPEFVDLIGEERVPTLAALTAWGQEADECLLAISRQLETLFRTPEDHADSEGTAR